MISNHTLAVLRCEKKIKLAIVLDATVVTTNCDTERKKGTFQPAINKYMGATIDPVNVGDPS